MHTLVDNGSGTWDIIFFSGDQVEIVIERGWSKQHARSMVHFLNGGAKDSFGGVVHIEATDS